jgi:hemerythrin-like domain-containing protein
MEISQLMSAMNMVETDHQLVVEKLQLLKDALGCLMDSERNATSLVKRIYELSKVIASRFSTHVAQQEIRLLPFLVQNLPEEPGLVATLRNEHERIERKSAELSNCLKVALELEEKLPHAVLWDVMTYGWELWELLDGHAHRETAAIRRCFAKFVQTIPGM